MFPYFPHNNGKSESWWTDFFITINEGKCFCCNIYNDDGRIVYHISGHKYAEIIMLLAKHHCWARKDIHIKFY